METVVGINASDYTGKPIAYFIEDEVGNYIKMFKDQVARVAELKNTTE
jgi:hypothetical protein